MFTRALFVKYEGSADAFNGWRFEGIFTSPETLTVAVTSVHRDVRQTKDAAIKTLAWKVCDL